MYFKLSSQGIGYIPVIVPKVGVANYSLFLALLFQRRLWTPASSKMEIFKTKYKSWKLTIASKNSIFDIVVVLDPPVSLTQNIFTERHKRNPIVSILASNMKMFVEQLNVVRRCHKIRNVND